MFRKCPATVVHQVGRMMLKLSQLHCPDLFAGHARVPQRGWPTWSAMADPAQRMSRMCAARQVNSQSSLQCLSPEPLDLRAQIASEWRADWGAVHD